MITLDKLTKSYRKGAPVVEEATCRIEDGEFFFLTGISGSGKTTLFKLLLLMERPDSGSIRFGGQEIGGLRGGKLAAHRRRIGMVFQDLRLLERERVSTNIALPLRVAGMGARKAQRRVEALLEQMGLAGRGRDPVLHLSGGEKQLVAMARAMAYRPELVLADEPTGNLDIDAALRVMNLLREINRKGCTVIVSTHDLQVIRALRARTLLIKNRRLLEVSLAQV